jgi:hypothetical protein
VKNARRDALNRHLGRLGEQFILEIERRSLLEAARNDLASRVEWVSETCGEGVGFDVLSFDDADDSERFQLYRVFDFSRRPMVYVLTGALSQTCQLDPMLYRAVIVGE